MRRYSDDVTTHKIRRRIFPAAISATVDELDRLADRVREKCGTTEEARWELTLPGVDKHEAKGHLAHLDEVDLSRLKGFTLWVGWPWDDHRVTMWTSRLGAFVESWAEWAM